MVPLDQYFQTNPYGSVWKWGIQMAKGSSEIINNWDFEVSFGQIHFGGFHKWWYPNSLMVYGKRQQKMDDIMGETSI